MGSHHRFVLLALLCVSTILTTRIMTRGRQIVPAKSRQLVVGTAASWSATTVELRRFERQNARSSWKQVGGVIRANLGKNGLSVGLGHVRAEKLDLPDEAPVHQEGDNRSPVGVFRIGEAYGYEDGGTARPEGLDYQPVTETWKCVDDPKSFHYNRVVDASAVTPDWSSAEEMRRPDTLYSRAIFIAANDGTGPDSQGDRPTPGSGSCIFFHVQRGPERPTAGCTSMPNDDIETMIRWLQASAQPVYVLMPKADYDRLSQRRGSALPLF